MNVKENIEAVQARICGAAKSAGRNADEITMIAVTKTVDAEIAGQVLDAGVCHLGENRVQAFLDKYEVLGDRPHWHIIGHLQTNKVKYLTGKVDLIHSVDSVHLAEEINKKAKDAGMCQDILFQFNISGEESKSGAGENEAEEIFTKLSALQNIRVRGLMTMAPLWASSDETRRVFEGLRKLSDKIRIIGFDGVSMDYLSMGMSGDFEAAIMEGANLVRIGSALFKDI